MSIPLFNLIVVNERTLFGSAFQYYADRYMENIIKHGAARCFVFQSSVLASGILLLLFSPLGIESLWMNWIIFLKTILLFLLVGLLSYVHLKLQPRIEALIANIEPNSVPPENIMAQLKPLRARRKKLASFCLFIVLTIIVLGLQVYSVYEPFLTIVLIALVGLFAWGNYKRLNRFGWM
ncbi:MAG: hypothetical protein KGZ58_09305 [Ignavibacteriales bacterium]|nr:hypothetical protein [Ignavibacteriales bacterium]